MRTIVQKVNKIAIKALEKYDKPTPKFWLKLGDSLLVIGTTLSSISAFTMPPYITAVATILTGLGKIITNFAS